MGQKWWGLSTQDVPRPWYKPVIPNPGPTQDSVLLQCVHGDVKSYLLIQVTLTVRKRTKCLIVGLAPMLAYPMITTNLVIGFSCSYPTPNQNSQPAGKGPMK